MTLSVVDKDEGVNAQVQYQAFNIPQDSSGRDLFLVSLDGVISTSSVSGNQLDREVQDAYTLTVLAQDSGNPSLSCKYSSVYRYENKSHVTTLSTGFLG